MGAASWLLIETENISSNDVLKKLKKLNFIKEINTVHGEYQILAKAAAGNFTLLDRELSGELRNMPGIRRITILPVLSEGVK